VPAPRPLPDEPVGGEDGRLSDWLMGDVGDPYGTRTRVFAV